MQGQILEGLSHRPCAGGWGGECVVEDWNVVPDCEGTRLPLLAEAHHNITGSKQEIWYNFVKTTTPLRGFASHPVRMVPTNT